MFIYIYIPLDLLKKKIMFLYREFMRKHNENFLTPILFPHGPSREGTKEFSQYKTPKKFS